MISFHWHSYRKSDLFDQLESTIPSYAFEVEDAGERPYTMALRCAELPGLRFTETTNSHTCRAIRRSDEPGLAFGVIEAGAARVERRRASNLEVRAGDHFAIRIRQGDVVDVALASNRLKLEISDTTLNDVVARHFHIPPNSPIEFAEVVTGHHSGLAGIRHLIDGLAAETSGIDSGPLQCSLSRQYADLLVTSLLARMPNSLSELLVKSAAPAPCGHVRRALDFMRAHVDKPITLEDIAREAGCSPRRLQTGFQAQLAITPMAKMRSLRLEAAEARLRSGDYLSVTDVALSVGFSNPGRFAGEFRRCFGVHPSNLMLTHMRRSQARG